MEHRVITLERTKQPFGRDERLTIIAGPCQIESEDMSLRVAEHMQKLCDKVGLGYVFKSSYDKANRSRGDSPRGVGIEEGVRILLKVHETIGCAVTTDVHDTFEARAVGPHVDIVQIPALLSRQTDLIIAAAKGCPVVNIKRGQFMPPQQARHAAKKAEMVYKGEGVDPARVILTERGHVFGYNDLVADMRNLEIMTDYCGHPVVFDASHSVQVPGAAQTGGQRRFIPGLARAAVAVGVAGVFIECHPDPEHALSDGPSSMALDDMDKLISQLARLDYSVKSMR
jgi:2-dehydro-3-deoxyphosphooctonate aldolase (KDO 8-P synthase)